MFFTKLSALPTGYYQGKPASPDTVKFVRNFQGIPVRIDRPRGFIMTGKDPSGVPWTRRYKYDYGYIPKTLGGDGDGLDVFIGPVAKSQHAYWAVQRKPDGSFDEYKVFLGYNNRDEAQAAYRAHIPKKLLGGMMTMRINMMKAMLGMHPEEVMKTASASMWSSCFDALVRGTRWE